MAQADEIEEIDAIPVLAPEAVLQERSRALVRSVGPSVQAAAVAAGGFVAGAAVVGLAQRRRRDARSPGKPKRPWRGAPSRGRGPVKGGELVQIIGTRSLLVDVHLLGGRDR